MKIQKRFIRKYKNKDYYRYVVQIPLEILNGSGLKEGDELDVVGEKDKIILSKLSKIR